MCSASRASSSWGPSWPRCVTKKTIPTEAISTKKNPDGRDLDEEDNSDGSDHDEGNGHQPRSSELDAWLLAPWASPTRSAEWSSSPTSIGLTDSSEPRRSLPDDVTKPAQDAAGNGASSRRVVRRAIDERVHAVVADGEGGNNGWVRGASLEQWHLAVGVVGLTEIVVGMLGLLAAASAHFGLLLFLGAVAVLCIVLGLRNPVLACTYLLIATFFRLAIPSDTFPVDPFLIAFAGVVASTWIWMARRRRDLSAVEVDPILCAIVLYITWNVMSMVLAHPYPPGAPLDPGPFSVQRFIVIGTLMPLAMFLVGRWVFISRRAIRVLLWSMVSAAAYSAVVSILQFAAPALVWPRYIVSNPLWEGRANGVFNQPVVNGLVLIVGFLAATLIASHSVESRLLRACAAAVAVASAYGVYLTHTRAVWLAFALVVIVGAVAGRGFRRGFVLTLACDGAGGREQLVNLHELGPQRRWRRLSQ